MAMVFNSSKIIKQMLYSKRKQRRQGQMLFGGSRPESSVDEKVKREVESSLKDFYVSRTAKLHAITQPRIEQSLDSYRITLSWDFDATGFLAVVGATVVNPRGVAFAIPLKKSSTANSMQALEAVNVDILTFVQRLSFWEAAVKLEAQRWEALDNWITDQEKTVQGIGSKQ
jgi:hypothetical protein